MDNFVTITNSKESILVFTLSVRGLDAVDMRVWFNIKTADAILSFECCKQDGDNWEVKIPVLSYIQKTAYPCTVTMVADGYYFEPMRGTVNVVGTAEIYSTAPRNVTMAPPQPVAEPVAEPVAIVTPAPDVEKTRKFSFDVPSARDNKQSDAIDRILSKITSRPPRYPTTNRPVPNYPRPIQHSVQEDTKPLKVVDASVDKIVNSILSETAPAGKLPVKNRKLFKKST